MVVERATVESRQHLLDAHLARQPAVGGVDRRRDHHQQEREPERRVSAPDDQHRHSGRAHQPERGVEVHQPSDEFVHRWQPKPAACRERRLAAASRQRDFATPRWIPPSCQSRHQRQQNQTGDRGGRPERQRLGIVKERRQTEQRLAAADAQEQRDHKRHDRAGAVRFRIEQRREQLRKQQHEDEVAGEKPERLHALHFQREHGRERAEEQD